MSSQRGTILNYLVATLLPTITISNGYNFNLAVMERGLKSYAKMSNDEFPAVFVSSADESRANVTGRDFQSVMTIYLIGMVKQNIDTLQIQNELDKLIEDVTKAIYTDVRLGNNVAYSDIKQILTDQGDQLDHAAFSMQLEVSYKSAGVLP